MDLFEAHSDGTEYLLASGLTRGEVDEVLDWWRYTKPFGSSVKIVVKEDTRKAFGMGTTGTDLEPILPSSEHIPSVAQSMPSKTLLG